MKNGQLCGIVVFTGCECPIPDFNSIVITFLSVENSSALMVYRMLREFQVRPLVQPKSAVTR